jgi:DNA mismatch endonuclease (patch repair protein)
MDIVSKVKRSWMMSRIRATNTKPEIAVRSLLHRKGYRFRLHDSKLPGKPDIVLPKHKSVIFVHGCFWHRHGRCKFAYVPKSRTEFWAKKFESNISRHKAITRKLKKLGWKVYLIWECETFNKIKLEKKFAKLNISSFKAFPEKN